MSHVTVLDGKLHVVHKEGSQVDLRANTLYSLVFFSAASHFIWVAWAHSVGPVWGPLQLCNGESKAEAHRKEALYQQPCLFETDLAPAAILPGSLRAPW